jgi:hypothetical protein
MKELKDGVERLDESGGNAVKSAVDQMIVREKSLTEKDERASNS